MKNRLLYYYLAAGLLIFVLGFATASFIFGFTKFRAIVQSNNAISGLEVSPSIDTRENEFDVDLFWNVWDRVDQKYVSSVDHKKMFYGALYGMVASLGDPFSVFLTPEDSKELKDDLAGSFSGIGAEVSAKDHKVYIVAPLAGSPALQAGILPGDLIVKVDDKFVEGMYLDEVVKLIRGPEDSKVKITIVHQGSTEEKEIEVTRKQIHVNNFDLSFSDNIAILKVNRFGDNFETELKEIDDQIIVKNPKGVILDLRNNPGGYFDDSMLLASDFIDSGVIVLEKGRGESEQKLTSRGGGKLTNLPMVVLINEGSASASEIVAGAIKDLGRGKLIGEKTFGKGSVQEVIPLSSDANLRLTVAKWYTPNGNSINEQGVTPDIEVKQDNLIFSSKDDLQLKRALEEINK